MKTTNGTFSRLIQSIITVCIFSAFLIAQNTLSIEVGDGTIDVLYNSDADIGGFQFTVEGATVTGGSSGDSAANGFMISCSSTMCLGFSMTGAVIPAGSGTLVVVSADITGDVSLSGIVVSDATGNPLDFTYDGGDVYGCMDMDACNYNADATEDDGSCALEDCFGECGGSAVEDECGECGGDGSSCATSTIDILYNTTINIGGFQFNIDGATVTGASGGDATANGFMISSSATTVLGFSLTGATIPAGSGVLVQVDVQGDVNAACLSAVVLSDAVGGAIDNEVTDCFTISQVEIIWGCTDELACNYNADATDNDGSCTYAEENYDCDGNCTAEVDCAGECGGSAVVDECGECGGDGIGGHACDCAGNVEDCAGDCGGSAVEDDCGVCGGDGTSCIPVQLGFGAVSDGNMEITYNSPVDIAGFQFNLTGANITSASGGAAGENGFMISSSSTTVIGFSLSGATIPAGSGVLIELTYEATAEQACLDSPVISDTNGEGIDIEIGSCTDLDYTCDDVDADGACDCAGNVEDCAGECGGSAEVDECGECGGDGIDEGACDCDGNVDDCNGDCGGTAEVDECGVCGGDGIDEGACDCAGNVADCAGVCGGSAVEDECGECGGDGICAITLSIEIAPGWNWFSLNVEGDMSIGSVMASLTSTDGDFIKSASASSTYYPDFGWYGGLDELGVIGMYKFNSANADLLVFSGAPVDPLSTPIALAPGWNWLGFTPQNDGATADALASIVTNDGDFIKNQGASSTYYNDFGWYGGLEVMAPTEGYMLSVAEGSVLTYPNFGTDDALTREKSEKDMPVAVYDWEVNYHDYEFNGHITMSIDSREDSHGDYIAVFAGDECRGLAERMYFPFGDSYMYSVMVYSNQTDGEELRFKYYDSAIGEIVEYAETIDFTSDMIVGDGFNTYSLSSEASDMQQPMTYGISEAYPNPFNPLTSFEYTLEKDGMVQVAVYDINGRMVSELVNGYQSAGSYPVVWDAQELSSGVYMLNMITGDYSTVQKVMLIK